MILINNLRVEYSDTPYGVDKRNPRFSWEIKSNVKNAYQEWYCIKVSDTSDFSTLAWDSQKVYSRETFNVEYRGFELEKDTKYYFCILCGINGKTYQSEISHFITGTMGEPINAQWITPQLENYHEAETCPMVRKTFSTHTENIDYATLQIHTFGLYELYINGIRPDDRLMAPAYSNNKVLIKYDVYEITNLIKDGNNAIALLIGDGFNDTRNVNWEGRKRLIASINIHYKDGTVENIPTDNTWKYNYNSPIVHNSLYDGEIYDATKEIDGWNLPDYDDGDWENVYYAEDAGTADWQGWLGPRAKIIQYIEPKKIHELKGGRYIIDFGQNMAGFLKISLSAKRGTRLRMRFAEEIKEEGGVLRLDTYTNRYAKATDTYIFKGEGIETYYPHFTYHGFRYVEVTGVSHTPQKGEFTACVIHADFQGQSVFRTDNKLLNRMHDNALWSFKSNNLTYPSDCPSRDERTDCAMDYYNTLGIGFYLYDISAYSESWLDNSRKHYKVNAPEIMTWSASYAILPWLLYKVYGDIGFIKENYKIIKLFMENRYLKRFPEFDAREAFGDWCAPHIPADYRTSFSSCKEIEIYTAVKAIDSLANMAELLGKKSDVKRYRELAEKGRRIFNNLFYDAENKKYSCGKQTPNIIALMDDFVPETDRKQVGQNLLNLIKNSGNRLDVGIYGARLFMECLSDIDSVDTALDCFTRDEFPSFKYQIDRGATTTWEQWYEYGDMASHNHQMFGGAMVGFYSRLAGITAIEPGYRVIGINPQITKYANKLKASVKTVCGYVDVDWKKTDEKFELKVNIPANCNAVVTLPNGAVHSVGNGKFNFECDI